MDFNALKNQYQNYVANTYNRVELDIVSGHGAICADLAGKEYIDFTSGIGVNCLGFADAGWADAVSQQLHCLQHTSNYYFTLPAGQLAQTLCARSGMQNVFLANSGAEANEGAIKAARKYARDKYGDGRSDIITLCNSFHGRTVTTLSATGQSAFHQHFFPFTPGFHFVDPNDIDALYAAVTPQTCAIMIELIQGEGGVIPLDTHYVKALAALCQEKDILLIIDEVQTGVGRTGQLFCYQHYNLAPDIVTTAKGLGGGLPIGAILFGEKTKHTLGVGDHATTFGGNPAICAGGNYILSRLDDAFLADVTAKGAYMQQKLAQIDGVIATSGLGLMLGATLAPGTEIRELLYACLGEGVLILSAKEKARFLPPLTITRDEIDTGLARFAAALQKLKG